MKLRDHANQVVDVFSYMFTGIDLINIIDEEIRTNYGFNKFSIFHNCLHDYYKYFVTPEILYQIALAIEVNDVEVFKSLIRNLNKQKLKD